MVLGGDGLKERLGYILPDRTAISVRDGGACSQLLVRTIKASEDELLKSDWRCFIQEIISYNE